jgi:DNA-binding MarR family transcriptional regulator
MYQETVTMVANGSESKLEDLAHHLFDVVTRFCLSVPRSRRKGTDLKDIEFLTLSLLNQYEPLIVGDIQRHLGVLPAQMSRIIRALETREHPLIACRINAQDKRKIDVVLTPAGKSAFQEHQGSRVRVLAGILNRLPDGDREELNLLLNKMNTLFDPQLVSAN